MLNFDYFCTPFVKEIDLCKSITNLIYKKSLSQWLSSIVVTFGIYCCIWYIFHILIIFIVYHIWNKILFDVYFQSIWYIPWDVMSLGRLVWWLSVQYLLCIPIHPAPVIHLCQFEFSLLNNLCLPHNLNKQCELTKWTV